MRRSGIASFGVLALLFWTSTGFAEILPWAARQRLDSITGLQRPADWERHAVFQEAFPVAAEEMPRAFDWRVQANGLPPVNSQAWNDCWAQGTVGVLESLLKIHYGSETRMSVQEVISCSGSGSARRGGYFAHGYHQKYGAVTSAQFPYAGRDVACKRNLKPSHFLARWGYVGKQGSRPTTQQMKQAILEHGPIGVTITANSALQRFTGKGVFKGCSNGGTNHIEVVVGWDDDEGGGVWIVRNSWGKSHGDNGYAKIPYGCSRIGEASTWADLKIPGVGFVPAIETIQ